MFKGLLKNPLGVWGHIHKGRVCTLFVISRASRSGVLTGERRA